MYKDGEEVPLTFTKQENGKYKYAPDAEDATATLVTDENGMIDVEGLDVGSYHFEETKAPEGYSINTDGKTLTLTKTLSDNESENVFTFTYTPGATDRIVETTTTVTTTVPGTATPAGAAGTTGSAGTTGAAAGTGTGTTAGGTAAGGTTAGGTTAGGTTTGGTAGGTTNADNSQDTTAKDKDTATSEDEQTPKSLVDLDDEDTPKGNIDAKDKTSKTPIAAGIAIIVVAVAALAGLIVFLKKRAK